MESYFGKYPAIVVSYNDLSRTCRVQIPGITDGGDVMPNAEICYPIGDKSLAVNYATEIEILPGDKVWIEFVAGDKRFPLIVGWRNPTAGNSIAWRRFHHANIELTADGVLNLNAPTINFNATTLTVNSTTMAVNSTDTNIASKVAITGSQLTHQGVNVSSTHKHGSVQTGSGTSGVPI